MTDVGTTPRKKLSPRERLAVFEAWGGVCCCCDIKITAGEPWIAEHPEALGLGGTDDRDAIRPAHKACADEKTYGPNGDLAKIAKAKARKRSHLGIKKPRTITRWRRFDGSVVIAPRER